MIEALALYLVAGTFVGLVAALFGVGGGFALFPTLLIGLTLQGMPAEHLVHMTAATTLTVMVATAGYAAFLRWRTGDLKPALVRRFFPFVAVGGLIGAAIGNNLPGVALKAIFAGFVLYAIVRGFAAKKRDLSGATDPSPDIVRGPSFLLWASLAGVLGGLMGPGPPVLLTPYLRGLGFAMTTVASTTAPLAATLGLFAGVGYMAGGLGAEGLPDWAVGYVYLPAVAGLIAGAFLGAPLGIRLSHRIDDHRQGRLFAVYLCIVLVVMLVHSWLTA